MDREEIGTPGKKKNKKKNLFWNKHLGKKMCPKPEESKEGKGWNKPVEPGVQNFIGDLW